MKWNKEQLASLARTKKAAVALSSAFSAVAGAAAGYVVAAKKLEKIFAQIAEKEIDEAKRFYSRLNKTEEFSDPEKLAKEKGYLDEDNPADPEMVAALEALKE